MSFPSSPLAGLLVAALAGGGLLALAFAVRAASGIRQVLGGTATNVYVLASGRYPLVLSETTPYRTVLRVFWPAFVAAVVGVVLLGLAVALVVA